MKRTRPQALNATSLATPLVAFLLSACATDPTLPNDENTGDVIIPGTTGMNGGGGAVQGEGGAVGVLLDGQRPTDPHCTVSFIGPLTAVTAAHCLQLGASPSRYRVVATSPVLASDPGTAVQQLYIHPLWDGDTTLVHQQLSHVGSRAMGDSPISQRPLYDLAVLKLGQPAPGATQLPNGPLPTNSYLSFASVYFAEGLNGELRSSEALSANNTEASAFVSTMPSVTSGTPGGAAAILSTPSGELLVGVYAGGSTSTGAVYTRLDAHQTFISDAIQGVTTGDYRLDGGGGGTGPTDFDCAMMSDNFCDYACDGDPDCEPMDGIKYLEFGQLCTRGADCKSGVCLMFDELNTRCSAYCRQDAQCPPQFECRPSVEGPLVCGTPLDEGGNLPPPPALRYFGADCDNDAQCSTGACISYGPGSKWCSELCTANDQCPLSYECLAAGNRRACVPPN